MSLLRLLGLGAGLVSLAVAFWQLRGHREGRANTWFFIATGLGAILVALVPDVANILTEFASLGRFRGSRLIALLILMVTVQWYLLISTIGKNGRLREQFDRFVRHGVVRSVASVADVAPTAPAILVAIPALNEAENLAHVLPRVPRSIVGHPVVTLVVNDGSEDDTEKVATEHGALVVSLPVNLGGGAALRVAYGVAFQSGTQVLVTLDGDGQHDPEEIEGLVRPILDGQADVVIGSRLLGAAEGGSALRMLGVRVFSRMINVLMGTRITDCSSGFRAIRVQELRQLRLVQDQYHTSELIIEAAKRKLRIAERPIVIHRRLSGVSRKGRDLLYGFQFFKSLVKTWLR